MSSNRRFKPIQRAVNLPDIDSSGRIYFIRCSQLPEKTVREARVMVNSLLITGVFCKSVVICGNDV